MNNSIRLYKKYMGFFLLLIIVLFMTGCSGKEETDKKRKFALKADKVLEHNPEDSELDKIIERVLNNNVFEGEMAKVNEKIIIEAYGLNNSNNIQIYASYMSTAAKADEITIIKTDNLKDLESYIQNYIEARTESFESYMPGEVKKLEEALTIAYGDNSGTYILCISGDKKAALKQITAE